MAELLGAIGIVFILYSIYTPYQRVFRVSGIVSSGFLLAQAILIAQPSLVFLNILIGVIHFVKLITLKSEKNVDIS